MDPRFQRVRPGKGFTGLKVFVIQYSFKPVFSCWGEKSTAVACQKRCVCLSMHVKGLTVHTHAHAHTHARTEAACAKSVCGKKWPIAHESLVKSDKKV